MPRETFQDFAERMGVPYHTYLADPVLDRNIVLFENGATSDERFVHNEPSHDPTERLRVRIAYYTRVLKRTQIIASQVRSSVETAMFYAENRFGSGPTDEDLELLKRVIQDCKSLAATLAQLQSQTPEEQERRALEAEGRRPPQAEYIQDLKAKYSDALS